MALLKTNTGIGTTNPQAGLHVQGTMNVTGVSTFRANVDITGNLEVNNNVDITGNLEVNNLTADQLFGDGGNLKGLKTTELVTYASASDISNSALNISGISTYNEVIYIENDASQTNYNTLACSANGKILFVGAVGGNSKVHIYERRGNSLERVGILTGFYPTSMTCSADGKTIVIGDMDADDGAVGAGSVYIFDREGDNYSQVGILTGAYPDTASFGDNFGNSVAVSADGSTIVVGDRLDELPSGSTGMGLVSVFDRQGKTFTRVGILTGHDETYYAFGRSVATSADGKSIFVVSPETSNTVPSIFAFDRAGIGTFTQVGIITGFPSGAYDFGNSIACSADGKTIAVEVDTDVYVIDRDINNFNTIGILTSVTSSGEPVSLSMVADGNKLVVGAGGTNLVGRNSDSGVSYVFERQGRDDNFKQSSVLVGSGATENNDRFGSSVATSADGKTIFATAFNDGPTDDGALYIFDEERETYLFSDTDGNIGIGSIVPTAKLDVAGGVNVTGKVGIGSTKPLVDLDVAGVIRQELHSPAMPVGLNDDIGVNWTKVEMGSTLEGIVALVYCGNGIVLAGGGYSGNSDGDIYRSTDFGQTWIKIEMGFGLDTIESLVYLGNGIVLAGSGHDDDDGDIYRSTDFGQTWTKIEMGSTLNKIASLVYCGNGIVLAGSGAASNEGDIYRSTDFGQTWTKIEMGSTLQNIYSLVYCGNGIVLAGSHGNSGDGDIYRSTDFGQTWTKIEMGSTLEAILTLVYCGNGIVLAGSGSSSDDGDVYRSTDFGQTWTKIEMGVTLNQIASLVYCGNGIVLAGGGYAINKGDIYRSSDFGLTWTKIEIDLDIIYSLVYCGNGIVLAGGGFGSSDGDVYRSDVGFSQASTIQGIHHEHLTGNIGI